MLDLEEGSGTEENDTELLEKARNAETPEDCGEYDRKLLPKLRPLRAIFITSLTNMKIACGLNFVKTNFIEWFTADPGPVTLPRIIC